MRIPAVDQHGYGCDTVNPYRFTGAPATDLVESYADTTSQDLHAEAITSRRLIVAPPIPDVTAICATGYFTAGALPVWAQCCPANPDNGIQDSRRRLPRDANTVSTKRCRRTPASEPPYHHAEARTTAPRRMPVTASKTKKNPVVTAGHV